MRKNVSRFLEALTLTEGAVWVLQNDSLLFAESSRGVHYRKGLFLDFWRLKVNIVTLCIVVLAIAILGKEALAILFHHINF